MSDPKQRFEVLDALRGVCASMIVLLHLKTPGMISNAALVQHGFLFVDFFFVLSGFVIAASYGERLATGFSPVRFMALRLGRVYPLHFVMLMAFLAFEVGFALLAPNAAGRQPFAGPYSVSSLLCSLFLVQIFFGPDATPWNGPSWSIAAEVWTYLIFAVLFRWARPVLVPVCLAIAAVAALYLSQLTDRYIAVFHEGALARCMFGFALGVAGFQLFSRIKGAAPGRTGGSVLEVLAIAATVGMVSAAGAGPLSLAMPPLFLLVVLLFALEAGLVSRLLRLKPFLLIGTLSYSIYMVHGFLEYRFVNVLGAVSRHFGFSPPLIDTIDGHNQIGGSPLFGDLMSLLVLALTYLLAWFTWRLVERPGQEWSRRRFGAPRKAEATAPTF